MQILKCLLLITWAVAGSGCARQETPDPRPGRASPEDTPSSQTRKPAFSPASAFRLEDYKGKVVLLNFWTTWCPPCRAEIPALVKLHQTFDPNQVAIIGVSVDDQGTPEQVQEQLQWFINHYQITYPVIIDNQYELVRRYPSLQIFLQIPVIPTTFLVDQQGNIDKTYQGARPFEVFSKDIQALLEPDSAKPKKTG